MFNRLDFTGSFNILFSRLDFPDFRALQLELRVLSRAIKKLSAQEELSRITAAMKLVLLAATATALVLKGSDKVIQLRFSHKRKYH